MHTEEEIDNAVCEIMVKWGPDGHVDGHDLITLFVMELLGGKSVEQSLEVIAKIME